MGPLLPLLVAALADGAGPKTRVEVPLAGTSATLTVDDTTGWPTEHLRRLVDHANGSTRDDCPSSGGGLMAPGDRVFVSPHYLAWFDLTKDDGAPYPPAFRSGYVRSGALAGLWALDPGTQWFRHLQRGPTGCTDWARNELIPGSASVRTDVAHWWDRYAPPVEHSLLVDTSQPGVRPCAGGDDLCGLMSYHLASNNPASGWRSVVDGAADGAGVHYLTRGRMVGFRAPWPVDVTDRDDANGIANAIEAEVEYTCTQGAVVVAWRFRATNAPIALRQAYTWFWTAYSKDQDDAPACDQGAGGEWPGTPDRPFPYFALPVFVESSLPLLTGGRPARQTIAPRRPVRLPIGSCPSAFPYANSETYTAAGSIVDGSWIRWSESASAFARGRRLRVTSVGVPGSGAGTATDPVRVRWTELLYADEVFDGVLGGGLSLREPSRLEPGRWYASTVAVDDRAPDDDRPGRETGASGPRD